jgi:hypothetical protein
VAPTKREESLGKLIEVVESFSSQLGDLSGRIDAIGELLQRTEDYMAIQQTVCWQCGAT